MLSPTTTVHSPSSTTSRGKSAAPGYVHRLYFRLDRASRASAVGTRQDGKCNLGVHKTKDDTYTAIHISFDNRKYMTVTAVKSCLAHIPAGSWVEGVDKSDIGPDPEGDKAYAYWCRKIGYV